MQSPLLATLRACTVTTLTIGLAASTAAQSAGGTLSGVLRSEDTRTPIAGAIVEIRALGVRTLSDSLGAFHIRRIPAGEVLVDIRSLGFQSKTVQVSVADDSVAVIEVHFRAVPMPSLEVASGMQRGDERMRGFHDRRSAGFGRFVTREDIERREVSDTKELLRGMPGVRLVGDRVQMSSSSSSPRCLVQYFVDAIHIASAPFDFLRQFRPRDIEGIEVYRGPAETPPEFSRGGAQCGVIAIWTRTPGGRR